MQLSFDQIQKIRISERESKRKNLLKGYAMMIIFDLAIIIPILFYYLSSNG